jgi:biopolymer transport protein ExbD
MSFHRSGFSGSSRRHDGPLFTQISAFPFLGFTFGLLVIFMMDTPRPPHHVLPDVAKASNSQSLQSANRFDSILISVARDGSIYFHNSRVDSGEVAIEIRESIYRGAEHKIYLTVDSRAKYGDVTPVIDQISATQIRDVFLITR